MRKKREKESIRTKKPFDSSQKTKLKWMLGISSSDRDQRGSDAEKKVLKALDYFKKKKRKFPGERKIKEFSPTIHFSPDDREGKDIIVKFQRKFQPDIEILPIQVQDWWTQEAEEEFRKRGICLIAIWPKEDEKKARERTFDAISKWFLRVEKEASSIS